MTRRKRKDRKIGRMIRLTPATHPNAWGAWMTHYRSPGVGMRNFAKFCEQEGHVTVPTLYPQVSKSGATP
jgi:hypothetical protein